MAQSPASNVVAFPQAQQEGQGYARARPGRPPRAMGETYYGEAPSPDEEKQPDPPKVEDLRKQFSDFVTVKSREIDEQRLSLAYYHNRQFTSTQLETFRDRRQAPLVFNEVVKKVNGIVGVLLKLRGDPKAFGRNGPDQQGADLATQCIRYSLDQSNWQDEEADALTRGLCTGICVAELALVEGDTQDPDIECRSVDSRTFFYSPRSERLDFLDSPYMGVSKFVSEDEFQELFPDKKWDDFFGGTDGGDSGQTRFEADKEMLWSQGRTKMRLVEHWYRVGGEWRWCFYSGGGEVIDHGESPFYDEKGKSICRYIAFAINIDEDGDHYGFVRNYKGPQDALNAHHMRAIWLAHARQIKVSRASLGGEGQDIETKRREAARADGTLVWENDPNEIEIISQDAEFLKHIQLMEDAKSQIASFGPNPALVSGGGGAADISGRSLAMQQQASLAELGPFLSGWKGWKRRIYRAVWVQQQCYWQAPRWVRVTKNQQVAQYVHINAPQTDQWGAPLMDPYGRPLLTNVIGNLDVEIIVDEGPNTINVMADMNDMLVQLGPVLAKNPQMAPLLIKTYNLPQDAEQELLQSLNAPDPAKRAAQQAEIESVKARTAKDLASAQKTQAEIPKVGADASKSSADAVHSLALAHRETHAAHATQVGAAVQQLNALAPQPQQPVAPDASADGGAPIDPGFPQQQ